jgi:hypothetical protein
MIREQIDLPMLAIFQLKEIKINKTLSLMREILYLFTLPILELI